MHVRFPYRKHGKWFVESWTDNKEIWSLKAYKCLLRALIEYNKKVKKL